MHNFCLPLLTMSLITPMLLMCFWRHRSNILLVAAACSTWLCPILAFLPLSAPEHPSLLKHIATMEPVWESWYWHLFKNSKYREIYLVVVNLISMLWTLLMRAWRQQTTILMSGYVLSSVDTIDTFKKQPKTHLFRFAFICFPSYF